jgi:hypothetical protein
VIIVGSGVFPLLDLRGCNNQAWALTSYDLVCKGEWESAKFAYFQYRRRTVDFDLYHEIKVNLQSLCIIDRISTQNWLLDVILFLVRGGNDYRTLSLEEGDTYFHAVVRMTLLAGKYLHVNRFIELMILAVFELITYMSIVSLN